MFRFLSAHCLAVLIAVSASCALASPFSIPELTDGFKKTVFGLEYRSWSWRPYLVKKYGVPVRFYVHNLAKQDRTPLVHQFIRDIGTKVAGLQTAIAAAPDTSNFQVFVVDRAQYEQVVLKDIFDGGEKIAPGRCLVRVISGRRGIKRSAAVIVSDEGEFLFRRCMVEEILQGLGPMNDDDSLVHSVFNDQSRHSRFTAFDQILLNMLYDSRIEPGMSVKQLEVLLPQIAIDARARVR
ncbi:DUF2927 domain-containing protein [Roseibium litorale]|uniref:DUF2927 domain-containing protein n=1 Tax=Roseibium litorale TaxID=2803841 RepID=A0ABR9CQI6_9HYPH|nr:DUF2927 domain-containing protein [Roseibium litorale]MBD8892933.1 DUF2927 domain-containing protein [Roseibium litorale]